MRGLTGRNKQWETVKIASTGKLHVPPNTAQSVADYLFTLPDEEIHCLYVMDTNGEGFCFSTYKRTTEALTGAMYKTRIDAIGN